MSAQARKANNDIDLTGKTAVLAGGSQGIGAGTAIRFAQAGANVIVIGRSQERLETVVSKARKVAKSVDQKFDYVSADLSLVSGTRSAAKEIEAKANGKVDYLIQTRFHTLYLCEIKFYKNPIGTKIIEEVEKKRKNLVIPKYCSIRPILIHVNGVEESVLDTRYFDQVIDFGQLLTQ